MENDTWDYQERWITRIQRLAKPALWLGAGVLLAYGLYLYRQHHDQVVREKASDDYVMMMYALQEGDKETVQSRAEQLMNEPTVAPYATLAAFTLSKVALEEGRLEDSLTYLQSIIDSEPEMTWVDLARTRLARILLSEGRFVEAQQVLEAVRLASFEPIRSELLGDAYVANGDPERAEQAYQKALSSDTLGSNSRATLVKMKLGALGISAAQ